jgi:hypothetical protein
MNATASRCTDHDQEEPCPVCLADRQESEGMGRPPSFKKHPPMIFTDRDMFIAIRAGMLGIAKALENDRDPRCIAIRASVLAMSTAIEKRYHFKPKKKRER